MSRPKRLAVAMVVWDDASFEQESEIDEGDELPGEYLQRSAGLLVAKTHREIVLSIDVGPDRVFRAIQRIPIKMVREFVVLWTEPAPVKKPRKKKAAKPVAPSLPPPPVATDP
jgi:hypothetical protein